MMSVMGRIACRCETVTEGEVSAAIRRGACTLDGVKFRTRGRAWGVVKVGSVRPVAWEILSLCQISHPDDRHYEAWGRILAAAGSPWRYHS